MTLGTRRLLDSSVVRALARFSCPDNLTLLINKLHGMSPQVSYIDRGVITDSDDTFVDRKCYVYLICPHKAESDLILDPLLHRKIWKSQGLNLGPLYLLLGTLTTRHRDGFIVRSSFPECRQIAGFKQTLEEKLGIPVKPKKPLTPFFRFMGQIRPMVAQQHPGARVTDHTKIIAQQWKELEPPAKQKLEEEFKKEMIHYLAVRVSYENSLTDQQKKDLQKAKEEKVESKQQKRLKMKKKELGKPKKPLSAFLIFFQEKANLRGDTPFKEYPLPRWYKGAADQSPISILTHRALTRPNPTLLVSKKKDLQSQGYPHASVSFPSSFPLFGWNDDPSELPGLPHPRLSLSVPALALSEVSAASLSRNLQWARSLRILPTSLPCTSCWLGLLISSVLAHSNTMYSGVPTSPHSHRSDSTNPFLKDSGYGPFPVMKWTRPGDGSRYDAPQFLTGGIPYKTLIWQQKVSQEWESLPDEKKVQYLDKASHYWQSYIQELQLWEEKMIRLGHIDVVRNEALIEPRSNK
uniref:HMG box domain-containing protein n=1 Tax=Timema monikensis TaxID=170555 RepID=A0A7R9EEH8_9NEOP|nr:unnamed protein product [Timema monikensis]